ncbi:SPP1 gp7 family putative phage head morphogenesis protein [Evansella vedderi]|uniref:SPP1 gp7 family putative phage head morphogenesis protein n=1 Tax=Evansella vedderi TaxID=38282 RepID=A0ABT9ZXR2_9BACI|nr:phage minor head protein [Evansella vedderi]MDQ0254920.1 SPP1 gp7 family putative phage head morphogenesis protein [Evansella vedderi]
MSLTRKFKQADRALSLTEAQTEKELKKSYENVLKEVQGELAVTYAQFGQGGKVEYHVMNRYHRLKKLEDTVITHLNKYSRKKANILKSSFKNQYADSFYRTAFALETEAAAKLGFRQLKEDVIMDAINNPISGLTLSDTLAGHRTDLIRNIRREITQGLIRGESYELMAKRLEKRLDGDYKKALRVARTESHRVQQEGRLKSMEHAADQGVIMKKMWVATLDESTRDAHEELDGKMVEVDDDFTSSNGGRGPAPGQMGTAEDDINCRCTVVTVIEGFEPKVRRSREVEGKRGEIKQYKTFKQWKKGRIDAA